MRNEKVILVLVDALRSDYITEEDSPFLYQYAKDNRYCKKVSQSRSFCERAEIFTGLSPRESGYFTAIGYSPDDSPYKDMNILSVFSLFEKRFSTNRYYKAIKNRVIRFLIKNKKITFRNYSIPVKILRYFSLTEDKYDFRDEKAFDGRDNIFKDCKEHGLNIYYDAFSALNFTKHFTDEFRLKLVEENINNDFNLFLLYIGVMDSCAHIYGPQSRERKSDLKKLDKRLAKFHDNIMEQNKNAKFVFLGDHGMADVTSYVDIGKEVENLANDYNMTLGKDFVYFLDSTMFRIWYLNDKAKSILDDRLKENVRLTNAGVFVDEELAIKEEIPFPDERYGHSLWLANLGVLIYPDFFHNVKAYKGMHGYDINNIGSKGTCIITSDKHEYVDDIKLADVYKILKNELNITK